MPDIILRMNIAFLTKLTQVDRLKFKTVKTVNSWGFCCINIGINHEVNGINTYTFNRFNGLPKLPVNLRPLKRHLPLIIKLVTYKRGH